MNIPNLASLVFSINKVAPQQPVQPQQTNATNAETPKFNPSPSNQELLNNMSPNQLNNLSRQVVQASQNTMTNMQQNVFLRDMLELPKDWNFLMREFAFSENAQLANLLKNLNASNQSSLQEALLALANSNARLNLNALAEFINKNSTLLADKLLKYMGDANIGQNNIAQLKNILLIGASIANSANVNPQEFVRDIMQMYLPWLPLVPPKEEDLNEIELKMAQSADKNGQILFYVSTKNLGYFKIEIVLENGTEIYITNITEFPNDELKTDLCKILKDGIKTISAEAKLFYSRKIDDAKLELKEKQLFIINSNDSVLGLSLIHQISRNLFEFDEKEAQRFIKAEKSNQRQ